MSLTRFVATLLLVGLAAPALAQSDRPNIVFIFSDDHAYQAIGAYGSRINQTPNIDRIAREGMRFENAMVTNSICAPSRAVIQTGKYSHLNGVLDNRQVFDGSQQTFPKLLQQAGYQTAMVGKWHLKSEPTGFDYWEVLPGQGSYYNPDFRVPGGEKRHYGYVTDIITDLTLAWLEDGRDPDRPFMVMTQNKAPHRGWMSGPDKLTLYDGVTIPEPDTLFDDYANRASPARLQEMEIGRHMIDGHDMKLKPPPGTPEDAPGQQLWLAGYGRLDERQRRVWDAAYEPKNAAFMAAGLEGRDLVRWKYQRYIKDYLRTIASVDDNVGRILRYLDETGLAENTIVVYASDQGFYLGEHGWFDKRWMYEESLKTPLIVRWPASSNRAPSTPTWCRTWTSRRRSSTRRVSRCRTTCRDAASSRSSRARRRRTGGPASTTTTTSTACTTSRRTRASGPNGRSSSTTTRPTSGSCSTWRPIRTRCAPSTVTRPTPTPTMRCSRNWNG